MVLASEGQRHRRGGRLPQYESVEAPVAAYIEVAVDAATGAVRVTRAVVGHDCGLIVNPDGLRNQVEGNVAQGISRALKEAVNYTADRVTTTVSESNTFNPLPQCTPIRFNKVPPIEIVLIDRPHEPAWGAGEPTIGAIGGAIANAMFAATGKRIRTLPITPERVRAATPPSSPEGAVASPLGGLGRGARQPRRSSSRAHSTEAS